MIRFKENSLCGGFLSDTLYDATKNACQLHYHIHNSFYIISTQNNCSCPELFESISVNSAKNNDLNIYM